MEITLEMVDQVRERTGCTYEEAKAALEGANGNVVDALIAIEKNEKQVTIDVNEKINALMAKISSAVQMGNVNRIRVMRENEELVNIPVNAGIVGGMLGVIAGPWAWISAAVAGAVAKFGFQCRFEIVREDGSIMEIDGEDFEDENDSPETGASVESEPENSKPENTESGNDKA